MRPIFWYVLATLLFVIPEFVIAYCFDKHPMPAWSIPPVEVLKNAAGFWALICFLAGLTRAGEETDNGSQKVATVDANVQRAEVLPE